MKKTLAIALAMISFSTFAADSYRVQAALQNISAARLQLEKAENQLRIALADETRVVTCSIVQPLGVVEGQGSTVELARQSVLKNCINSGYTASTCQQKLAQANCYSN